MMNLSAGTLVLFGLVAFAASIPQFLRLIKLRRSDQFSIPTWSIWLAYQISSLVYAIHINSLPYILLNILWVGFYAVMLVLIVRYKQ